MAHVLIVEARFYSDLNDMLLDGVRSALDAGLLINVTRDNVIRLLPPLIVTRSDADLIVERLAPLVARFVAAPAKAA